MWCPKCKMEYRDGITVCADCGEPLVEGSADDFDVVELCTFKEETTTDSLIEYLEYSKIKSVKKVDNGDGTFTVTVPASMEKKAEKLFRGFLLAAAEKKEEEEIRKQSEKLQDASVEEDEEDTAEDSDNEDSGDEDSEEEEKEYDWDAEESEDGQDSFEESDEDYEKAEHLGVSDSVDETPEELLYAGEANYISREEEYNDMKYSGITFVVFGILGGIYLTLCKLNVIPISYNTFVFVVICLLFAGFVVLGIVNVVKANKIKLQIPEEKEKMEQIMNWLTANITPEKVEKWTDDSVTEMENDLTITSHIRTSLIHEFPDEAVSFLEYMADKFYTEKYLDGDAIEESSDEEQDATEESLSEEMENLEKGESD